jgi:hypothetical protein
MPVFGVNGLRRRRERRIAKAPTATASNSSLRAGFQYTVDPQRGQK